MKSVSPIEFGELAFSFCDGSCYSGFIHKWPYSGVDCFKGLCVKK